MDEVLEFCERVLGVGAAASEAARSARAGRGTERLALLAAASQACRAAPDPVPHDLEPSGNGAIGLAAAVSRELASATSQLPERQREALALREHARLSYEELSEVMGIGVPAVALLLARARLRLREERRGAPPVQEPPCEHRDRALRALAQRQDGEQPDEAEDSWITGHLFSCVGCGQAHAAMLEASVCYRAWTLDSGEAEAVAAEVALDRPEPQEPPALPEPPPPEPEPASEPEAAEPAPATPQAPDPTLAPIGEQPARGRWWSRFRSALADDARR